MSLIHVLCFIFSNALKCHTQVLHNANKGDIKLYTFMGTLGVLYLVSYIRVMKTLLRKQFCISTSLMIFMQQRNC